ncbi:hypothetical protein QEN19_000298 [Hanseniaspora menglaensis]
MNRERLFKGMHTLGLCNSLVLKKSVQTTAQKITLNCINTNIKHTEYHKIKNELSKFTVKSLKQQLKTYNLKVSGNKSELIDRLANINMNLNGFAELSLLSKTFQETLILTKTTLKEKKKKSIDENPIAKLQSTLQNNVFKKVKNTNVNIKKIKNTSIKLEKSKQRETNGKSDSLNSNLFTNNKQNVAMKEKVLKKNLQQRHKTQDSEMTSTNKTLFINAAETKNTEVSEFKDSELYVLKTRDVIFLASFFSFSFFWLLFVV